MREMEKVCNEMHCKEEHGAMVSRIHQDNEYKESMLWTYHKEELQRIRSNIEKGLRMMFSLLRKQHGLQKHMLRMQHEDEWHTMQEKLDNQKSKEEKQRAASLFKSKVFGETQQVANASRSVHTKSYKHNSKRSKDGTDQRYPGNTAKVVLVRTNWRASQHSFKRGIRKARAWCRANSEPVDLSDHFGTGAEVFTAPAKGTFHMTFEYDNRELTLFIYGKDLYVKGWHGDRFGIFEIQKNFVPNPSCQFLDIGDNYHDLCQQRDVANVRIGPEALIESFEVLYKCNGVVTTDLARSIAMFAVGSSEAIWLQDIFEVYIDSFDPTEAMYIPGKMLAFWIRSYRHYSIQYLKCVNCILNGDPVPDIENRQDGNVNSVHELRHRIRVPIRAPFVDGRFLLKKPKTELEEPETPVWSPPYEDGKDWDDTELDNEDIRYRVSEEREQEGSKNCSSEEEEGEPKNWASEKEMQNDDDESKDCAEEIEEDESEDRFGEEMNEDDDDKEGEDVRAQKAEANIIKDKFSVIRSSIFRFSTAMVSGTGTIGKTGLFSALASGGMMNTMNHYHPFPTALGRIKANEVRSSFPWRPQGLSGWRMLQSASRCLRKFL
ncbi:unnamed protein product [Urochloa humidicola]